MFLIEKYTINNENDMIFHKDLLNRLLLLKGDDDDIKSYNDLSHLLFYGIHGCGKSTLINLFLSKVYDDSIYKTKKTKYTINGYGNSNIEVELDQSNYHITLVPNNNGFDKYLIQNVIKEYASRQIFNVFKTKKKFKTIVIKNVDNLSYYAQTSLRCTMEKYIHRCKFILCAYQMSRIIDPLKSRCMPVRVNLPKKSEIFQTLFVICMKENININFNDMNSIVNKSDRNIKKALWLLQLKMLNIPISMTWEKSIVNITKYIKNARGKQISLRDLDNLKLTFYNIFISNIKTNDIFIEFTKQMLSDITDPKLYLDIASICSEYETRSKKGKRHIIHLEAMVNKLLLLIYNYKPTNKKKLEPK